MTFKTEEEALKIANDSQYGLAGVSVFSRVPHPSSTGSARLCTSMFQILLNFPAAIITNDVARRTRLTKKLRVGIVWWECSQPGMHFFLFNPGVIVNLQ